MRRTLPLRLISSFLLCILLHGATAIAAPWDTDSVRSLLDHRVLANIEGVWQQPDDGATVLIYKQSATTFDIVILDSPDLSVHPGTKIGRAVTTPDSRVYDARISADDLGRDLKNNSKITVNNNSLKIEPYKTGWKISLRRLLYRVFHVSIVENGRRPSGLDGMTRVYPVNPENSGPVCL